MDHTLHVFAGDIELAALHGAAADKDRVKIAFQFVEGNVSANSGIEINLYAQILNDFNFRIENILGQAVFGNADSHPAARHRQGFVNHHLITFNRQVVRTRKS